ncbi:hypothetical protein D3C83_128960 [compost metagenome]
MRATVSPPSSGAGGATGAAGAAAAPRPRPPRPAGRALNDTYTSPVRESTATVFGIVPASRLATTSYELVSMTVTVPAWRLAT